MEWINALPIIEKFLTAVGIPVIISIVATYIAVKLADKVPGLISAYTDQVSTLNKLVDNNTKAVEGVTQAVNSHKELLVVHHENAVKMREDINTLNDKMEDLSKEVVYVKAKVQ